MNELSPEERALIELACDVENAPGAVRERVRGAVLARVAATAGVTAASTVAANTGAAVGGVQAAGSAGAAVLSKVILGVGLLAGGGGVGLALRGAPALQPAEGSIVVLVEEIGRAAEGSAQRAATSDDRRPAPVDAGARNDEPPRRQPAPPPATPQRTAEGALERELSLLREVQHKLQAGDPRGALALLDEREGALGGGALHEERSAARIFALCALGRVEEALSLARDFLRASPESPLAGRVSGACGAPLRSIE